MTRQRRAELERSLYIKFYDKFFAPIEGGNVCGLCNGGVVIGEFLDHLRLEHPSQWKRVCEGLNKVANEWIDMQQALKWENEEDMVIAAEEFLDGITR